MPCIGKIQGTISNNGKKMKNNFGMLIVLKEKHSLQEMVSEMDNFYVTPKTNGNSSTKQTILESFEKIAISIISLDYYDTPDYNLIREELNKCELLLS